MATDLIPRSNQIQAHSVTVFVLAPAEPANLDSFLAHLQETAGIHYETEMVSPDGGIRTLNEAIQRHPLNDIILVDASVRLKTSHWLSKFQARARQEPKVGILGAKFFDRSGLIYSSGRLVVSRFGLNEHLANIQHGESDAETSPPFVEVDTVLPWLCFIKREVYDKVGGFDERFMGVPPADGRPPWLEQDDFCLSARAAGYSVGTESAIEAAHSQATLDPRFEALYQNQSVPPLIPLDSRIVNLWRKKWRWHPGHPDLNAVRERWLDTPVCWRIGNRLLDQWPSPEPLVDLLLVTRNNLPLLRQTLDSLAHTSYRPFRLWIHVNGSNDETWNYLNDLAKDFSFPMHLVQAPVNLGYTPAFNWLLHLSDAPLVAKLDDDIELSPDWLDRLVKRLRDHSFAGAVGAKIVHAANPHLIQWADYHAFPSLVNHNGEQDRGQFDYLSRTVGNMGCCVLYRRRAIEEAGPLDIALNPISWDDLDHQIALWAAGYDVLYDGGVTVRHPSKSLRDHCRRTMKNTCGNGFKVQIKWGPGALAILDQSLEPRTPLD